MTYGLWISRARVHLGDAAEQLAVAPAAADRDVLALVARREIVYQQLHRTVALLLNNQATGVGRPRRGATTPVEAVLNRFRDRLHLIATDNEQGMPSATSHLPAAASLTAAGDCLGLAADILASHLLPRPRTPEGLAIQLGAGVAPALAELAHATMDALAVDQALQAWLSTAAPPSGIVAWAADATRRATTGPLPAVLRDVITTAPADPRLLDELHLAPTITATPPAIETPTSAAATLRAIRTWLWQHPARVHAVHLRLGTQVGLAVNYLDTTANPRTQSAWRRAVGFADDIEGSTPTDDGAHATARLADLLIWVRTRLTRDDTPPTDELTAELPGLAHALLTGLNAAVARGHLFVNRSRLDHRRKGVLRAKTIWARATRESTEISGLQYALAAICRTVDQGQPQQSRARAAFQRPPQAAAAALTSMRSESSRALAQLRRGNADAPQRRSR